MVNDDLLRIQEGHPSCVHLLKYFCFQHLDAYMQDTSKAFAELAFQMFKELPDNPEKSAALRKLLEAKDCAVRARLG